MYKRQAENFAEYIVDAERGANSYDYVVSAMRRWYMALPKYAKESKKGADGKKMCIRDSSYSV